MVACCENGRLTMARIIVQIKNIYHVIKFIKVYKEYGINVLAKYLYEHIITLNNILSPVC